MKLLVTGSNGLVGSECVFRLHEYFDTVHGIDNNMRMNFFGPGGDTRPVLKRIIDKVKNYVHHDLDITNREWIKNLYIEEQFDVTIHCASQPSHDLSDFRPFDDFEINTIGTLNLLEANKANAKFGTFVFMSTTKVYGDGPNKIDLIETDKRFDYNHPYEKGLPEIFPVDNCMHGIFGASKLAADTLVQEYGRKYNMPTVCYRAGCITGENHAGVQMHGFLSYLFKCAKEKRKYSIFGYGGKQVRDQIHASDMVEAIRLFIEKPRVAEIYNIGGGLENSISILEAIDIVQEAVGDEVKYKFVTDPRAGDQKCNVHDLTKLKKHYPSWKVTKTVKETVSKMI